LHGIVKFDVYGPFYDGLDSSIFDEHTNIAYHGPIDPERVDEILCNAVALILPTYMAGEGYPGSVIEAFNAGLPVVATTWRSIPEIVDESCGILVEPKNPDALANAIGLLARDPTQRKKLSEGSYNRRLDFDQTLSVQRFITFCKESIQTSKN
jgi:glycosyltransferase involved in cell wall biosynthesis